MRVALRNGMDLCAPKHGASIALASVLALLLAACDKKPGGQVVAVVSAQEITQQELLAEAEANNVPPQNFKGASAALLERIVQRDLLANYAREQGLDRNAEYVTRRRALEQTLLSSLALRKILGTPAKPAPQEVQAFVAANPTIFAQRAKLELDQVRFPTPGDPAQVKALTALGSLSAIEAKVKADGGQVARGNTTLDTATLDPGVAKQIGALPNGEIFDLSIGGTTFVSVITARSPAATDPATWTGPATNLLQRQKAERAVAEMIEKLRKEQKIEYDPAYQPKKAR